jgi:hypothetical protein
MSVPPEPQHHLVCPERRPDRLRRHQRAPGGALAKPRLCADAEPRAQAGPQPVGAHERDPGLDRGAAAQAQRRAHAVGMQDEILDPRAEPKRDIGVRAHRVDQRRLQVAAMDRPVRRAVARFDGLPERDVCKVAAAHGHDRDRVGRDGEISQPVLQPEREQHARGVGRELDAGPDIGEGFGLLQERDAEARLRERQRRGQSADAGACDDDVAR